MSREKLIRMYSEQLEYLCDKFGVGHYIYLYDKTFVEDFSFIGFDLETLVEIDLGLLLVQITDKPDKVDVQNNAGSRVVVYFDDGKSPKAVEHQTFSIYHLTLLQVVSFHTGRRR